MAVINDEATKKLLEILENEDMALASMFYYLIIEREIIQKRQLSENEIRKNAVAISRIFRGKLKETSLLYSLPTEILFHIIQYTGDHAYHEESERLKITSETIEKTIEWFRKHDSAVQRPKP